MKYTSEILKEYSLLSSITQVKIKCGLSGLNTGIKGIMPTNVSSKKEKLILETFKALNLV